MDDLKRFKLEEKKRKVAKKAGEIKDTLVDLWRNDKGEVIMVSTLLIGGFKAVCGTVRKHEVIKSEQNHRDLDHYDPRTGVWSQSKRKLSKKERLVMDERYKNGESKIKILEDLGVLK